MWTTDLRVMRIAVRNYIPLVGCRFRGGTHAVFLLRRVPNSIPKCERPRIHSSFGASVESCAGGCFLIAPMSQRATHTRDGMRVRGRSYSLLVGQFQSELDMAGTARSKHRISPPAGGCRVRCGAGTTELSAVAWIRIVDTGNREVRMIKEIEELRPELGSDLFLEFPLLRYREIDIVIIRAAKCYGSRYRWFQSRRSQNTSPCTKQPKFMREAMASCWSWVLPA